MNHLLCCRALLVTCLVAAAPLGPRVFALHPYVCDNPFDISAGDADADGVTDACDCDPNDASVFWVPPEVSGLTVDLSGTFAWSDLSLFAGAGLSYDVVKGNVADLRAGVQTTEVCAAEDWSVASFLDTQTPPQNTIWFYVVRGNHSCAAGSFAGDRVHAACQLPPNSPPPPVAGVEGHAAGPDVTVAWRATPGAVDYAIYRVDPSASERHGDCLVSGLTASSFTDVNALAGSRPQAVSYYVVGRNGFGESSLGSNGSGQQIFRSGTSCP